MVDKHPDLNAAADAAIEQLRERMQTDADRFVYDSFEKMNEYVDEDLAPILAVAGVATEATRWAFLRMVITRLFKYGHSAAWGPTEREQKIAQDFAQNVLARIAQALTETVGEPAQIAVIWGEGEEDNKPPEIIRPGEE